MQDEDEFFKRFFKGAFGLIIIWDIVMMAIAGGIIWGTIQVAQILAG